MVFLTSALDGGERSASRPCRFSPGNLAPVTHWIGACVVPRAGLELCRGYSNLFCRESNPVRPAHNSSLYWLSYSLPRNKRKSAWFVESRGQVQALQHSGCVSRHGAANVILLPVHSRHSKDYVNNDCSTPCHTQYMRYSAGNRNQCPNLKYLWFPIISSFANRYNCHFSLRVVICVHTAPRDPNVLGTRLWGHPKLVFRLPDYYSDASFSVALHLICNGIKVVYVLLEREEAT
jgi:hypothetical protein